MNSFSRLADAFLDKMESQAAKEGSQLRKPFKRALGLISWIIGIVFVILLALWLAHHA